MKLTSLFSFFSFLAVILAVSTAHTSPSQCPVLVQQVVQPATSVVYSPIELKGKEITDVFVSGHGGELECTLFNEKGSVVSRAGSGNDNVCRMKFMPEKKAKFTLMVTNTSSISQAFISVIVQ